MTETIVKEENQESIKLCKMSKGYNWEIKLYGKKAEDLIERIAEIDKKVRERLND